MNVLVGYTGFVGSNIYMEGKFDAVYNSKNIEDAYGKSPDLLVYAGLSAEKYLANSEPKKDMEKIIQAQDNIKKIDPKKLVLISTIDVFNVPKNVDEDTLINTEGLNAYGYNRYLLECWVRKNYPDALIIRLPGLFGRNIKKNFIYDYMNIIPVMLKKEKFEEFLGFDQDLNKYYTFQDNGFYKVDVPEHEKELLKSKFRAIGFSALNFTDSRSSYQFYPLKRLWNDINICLKNNLLLWHPATEPMSAGELYYYLTGETFINELNGEPQDYNYKTKYADLFGGSHGYILEKSIIKKEIADFVEGVSGNE